MGSAAPRIAIVIPAYQAAGTLPRVLGAARAAAGGVQEAATDAEMDFIPASIEGSPRYVGDKHAGRLRGMVFVGAPVGDDEWVAEELRFIFGKLVSRLPASRKSALCMPFIRISAPTLMP